MTLNEARTMIVAGVSGAPVRIWHVDGSKISEIASRSSYAPTAVFVDDDKDVILTGTEIRLGYSSIDRYEVKTGRHIRSLQSKIAPTTIAHHPDQPWLAVVNTAVVVLNSDNGTYLRHFYGPPKPIQLAEFDAQGKLWTVSKDGTLRRWSLSEPRYMSTIPGHRAAVTSVASVANGAYIVSGDTSGRLLITDVAKQRRQILDVTDSRVRAVLEVGASVFVFFGDGYVAKYSMAPQGDRPVSNQAIASARWRQDWIKETHPKLRTASTSPTGFFTTHDASEVLHWTHELERDESHDIPTAFEARHLANHAELLAYAGEKRLHIAKRQRSPGSWAPDYRSFELPADATTLCFTVDGKRLLVGGKDSDIYSFEVESGEQTSLIAHPIQTSDITAFTDGKVAASMSWAGDVFFWDLEHMSSLGNFKFNGMILSASVSPDGSYLALGIIDGSVRVMWFDRSRMKR